jgi:hypothetical protein
LSAVISQRGAPNACDLRLRIRALAARRTFVGAQPRKRIARQLGIVLRRFPDKLEEQRQRPRRAFMLRRTMLR